jgi:hypothetical protein
MTARMLLIAVAILTCLGLQASLVIAAFADGPDDAPFEPVVRESAMMPVMFWFIGMALRIQIPIRYQWLPGFSKLIRLMQAIWLTGALLLVSHVVIAFHVGHFWSIAAAMRHIESQSGPGTGWGLFVSLAFALLWLVDAILFAVRPVRYAHRTLWLSLVIYGFMAFVVFNATVIYGREPMRWYWALAFGGLLLTATSPQTRRLRSWQGEVDQALLRQFPESGQSDQSSRTSKL